MKLVKKLYSMWKFVKQLTNSVCQHMDRKLRHLNECVIVASLWLVHFPEMLFSQSRMLCHAAMTYLDSQTTTISAHVYSWQHFVKTMTVLMYLGRNTDMLNCIRKDWNMLAAVKVGKLSKIQHHIVVTYLESCQRQPCGDVHYSHVCVISTWTEFGHIYEVDSYTC